MGAPVQESLRNLLSQGNWDAAVESLQQMRPADAANLLKSVPFEQERTLFRKLPVSLAAALIHSEPPHWLKALPRNGAYQVFVIQP